MKILLPVLEYTDWIPAFAGMTARSALYLLVLLMPVQVHAEISITDDAGRPVQLAQPAQRIVTLAPYLAELVFAAGAGERLVGVSAASDYPAEVTLLPRLGGPGALDVERVLSLKPDLVLAWQSGNTPATLVQLQQAGIPVYLSEPRSLVAIAQTLQRIGLLAGTPHAASDAVSAFKARLVQLRERYAGRVPVTVFYQVWDKPLMTINGEHIISDAMALCGGRNVYADLRSLVPRIDIESIFVTDPQVMLAAVDGPAGKRALDSWRRWPQLGAVRNNHLYTIPGDRLVRHTPRILDGVEQICELLERVRTD